MPEKNHCTGAGLGKGKKVCEVLDWKLDLATTGLQWESKERVWSWAQGWFLCHLCPSELCLSVSCGVFICVTSEIIPEQPLSMCAGADLIPKDLLVFHYPKRAIYSDCVFLSAGWAEQVLKSGRFYQEKESVVLNVSYFYCTYLINYFSQSGGYLCVFQLLQWKSVQGGMRPWLLQHLELPLCAVPGPVYDLYACDSCLCDLCTSVCCSCVSWTWTSVSHTCISCTCVSCTCT